MEVSVAAGASIWDGAVPTRALRLMLSEPWGERAFKGEAETTTEGRKE